MNTYKVVQDSKREEFRKYLEKNGVMDVLTRCLVSLYEEPEKPADALQYVRNSLGAASPDKVELDSLRLLVAEMTEKMTVMEEENRELRDKVVGFGRDGDGDDVEVGEQAEAAADGANTAAAAAAAPADKPDGKEKK